MIRMAMGESTSFGAGSDTVDCSPPENEYTDIVRFSMRLPFTGQLFRNQCNALEIEIERIAETTEDREGLASKYLFGQQSRGDAWVVPAEVVLVNPNAPDNTAIQGKFTIDRAQVVDVVVSDDDKGPPRETIRIVCTGVKYEDVAGSGSQMWNVPLEVPNF